MSNHDQHDSLFTSTVTAREARERVHALAAEDPKHFAGLSTYVESSLEYTGDLGDALVSALLKSKPDDFSEGVEGLIFDQAISLHAMLDADGRPLYEFAFTTWISDSGRIPDCSVGDLTEDNWLFSSTSRAGRALILLRHVSPTLATSVSSATRQGIREFLAFAEPTGMFLDTIAQEIDPLVSTLSGQPHAYLQAILAMQRLRDWGRDDEPLNTNGSADDALGLALLIQAELKKLQPPVQGDLFHDGEGEVCIEQRQW